MRDGIKDKNDLATAHFYTMRPCAEFGLHKLADTLQNKCFLQANRTHYFQLGSICKSPTEMFTGS